MKNLLSNIIITLTLAAFALSSCATETLSGEEGKLRMVLMSVPLTRAGETPEEVRLSTARLIVVRSDGQSGANKVIVNSDNPTVIDYAEKKFQVLVPVGYIDIYLFTNELTAWNLASFTEGSTFRLEDLRAKTLNFTDYPAVAPDKPIPMFLYHQRVHISQDGSMTKSGEPLTSFMLQRLFSKVELKLNCPYSELPGATSITIDSIRIRNLPAQSSLLPTTHSMLSNTSLFDGSFYPLSMATASRSTALNGTAGFYKEFVFYIPEYLLEDASKRTYITIVAHKNFYPANRFHYTLTLGDGMASKSFEDMRSTTDARDLRISRNVCYTFNVTAFTGFGDDATRTITFTASVNDWIVENVPL